MARPPQMHHRKTRGGLAIGGVLVILIALLALGCRGPTLSKSSAPTPTPGGPSPKTPLPAPTDTPVAVAVGARPGDARRGQALFAAKGAPAVIRPGRTQSLALGSRVSPTRQGREAYITESIRNPAVFVVPGFADDMPPFTTLTDQEFNDLIEYLKTLK